LLYGQTGPSLANQQLKINFIGPATSANQTSSRLTPGFSLGGGAEVMLPAAAVPPFVASTSLFVAYQHTWWAQATLNQPAASPFYNYSWQRGTDAVTFGVRMRFGAQ
jgi:hypothetical protein